MNSQLYKITFRDIFSHATDTREVQLTDAQVIAASEQRKNKTIVVNKLINHIRTQLVIEKIELILHTQTTNPLNFKS